MASRRKAALGNEVLERLRAFRTRLQDFDVNEPIHPEDFELLVAEVEVLEDRLNRQLKIRLEDGGRLDGAERIWEEFEAAEDGPGLTPQTLTSLRDHMIWYIDSMITKVNEFLIRVNKIIFKKPNKDLGSILETEKEFLSKKVPKELAEHISSYATGKEGSLGAQKSQLRTQVGISGVPSQGGKKTRRSKKTRIRK